MQNLSKALILNGCFAIFIALLAIFHTSCFLEKDDKGIDKLRSVYTKFEDIFTSIQKIPRISLGSQLSQLHTLQSELEDIEVSKCLNPAKIELGNAIRNFSRGVAFFMKMDEKRADDYFVYASENLEKYQKIFFGCQKRN